MLRVLRRLAITATFLALAAGLAAAQASDEGTTEVSSGGDSSGMNVHFGGFIRQEFAFKTGFEDPNTERGNPFDGVPVTREGAVPILVNLGLPPLLVNTIIRPIPPSNNVFALHYTRLEFETDLNITRGLRFVGRARALYDPSWYSKFDPNSVGSNALPATSENGRPNFFQYQVDGSSHPVPLEWGGRNYLVNFPALYLDYSSGPLEVRIGNQQIAWGQAIFFRVFDAANGLDFRRHLIFDYFTEEFADKRVPAPAARFTYGVTDAIVADGFVEQFIPSVFPNPNTSYSIIPSEFTVRDRYIEDGFNTKVNYGMRVKGDFGDFSLQAMAVRRYNPDGVFGMTASGINRPFQNTPLGSALNLAFAPLGGTGALLAKSPFEVDNSGLYSAKEYEYDTSQNYTDSVKFFNSAIDNFPALRTMTGTRANNQKAVDQELDAFFTASPLRGHVQRTYLQEDIFALGGSYILSGPPNSLIDQLIVNLEVSYTPKRTFTNNFEYNFLCRPEYTGMLSFEKWFRFFRSIPGEYILFEWYRKTQSNLYGFPIRGMGATPTTLPTGIGGQYNLYAIGVLQPFAGRIWELDFLAVGDPKGGIFSQTGVKWKPGHDLSIDAFYNYVNGHLGNPSRNTFGKLDFADEFSLRVGWQF